MSAPPWRIGNDLNPQRRDARVPPRLGGESTCAWVCVRSRSVLPACVRGCIALAALAIQLLRVPCRAESPAKAHPALLPCALVCSSRTSYGARQGHSSSRHGSSQRQHGGGWQERFRQLKIHSQPTGLRAQGYGYAHHRAGSPTTRNSASTRPARPDSAPAHRSRSRVRFAVVVGVWRALGSVPGRCIDRSACRGHARCRRPRGRAPTTGLARTPTAAAAGTASSPGPTSETTHGAYRRCMWWWDWLSACVLTVSACGVVCAVGWACKLCVHCVAGRHHRIAEHRHPRTASASEPP